jgi:hypothetical protein
MHKQSMFKLHVLGQLHEHLEPCRPFSSFFWDETISLEKYFQPIIAQKSFSPVPDLAGTA